MGKTVLDSIRITGYSFDPKDGNVFLHTVDPYGKPVRFKTAPFELVMSTWDSYEIRKKRLVDYIQNRRNLLIIVSDQNPNTDPIYDFYLHVYDTKNKKDLGLIPDRFDR